MNFETAVFLEKIATAGYDKNQLSEIHCAIRTGISKDLILKIFHPGLDQYQMREINLILETLHRKGEIK